MPDGWKEIALALIAAATGGIALWFKSWREDRKAKVEAVAAEKRSLEARVEKLQDKLESLLMDAAAQAKDDKREKAERIAMDAKLLQVSEATASALKEATVIMARIERGTS